MEAGVIADEGRAAVGGALQDVGTGAARIAADVNDAGVIRIDADGIVVRALTAAVTFRGDERSAPGHAAVNGLANPAGLAGAGTGRDGGRFIRSQVDRDDRADFID